jgi:hypothetical protein
VAAVRPIRGEIETRIRGLLADLLPAAGSGQATSRPRPT